MTDIKSYDYNGIVAGIDEVARGPFFGRIYSAAVILPKNFENKSITDSKKISRKKRGLLRPLIEENALSYCVSWVDVDDINRGWY